MVSKTLRGRLRVKHTLGLAIGKFLPPHLGHKFLIDTATAHSRHTIVIVCAKPSDPIPGELRAAWLQEIHPAAEIRVIDDRYDENDSQVWAENTIRWLGRAPDAVFTSEDYGHRYAALMGSRHIQVDRPRTKVPISATAIRNDPYSHWNFLEPPVRAWFTRRICVLGAESTGTTTLARDLASALNTNWVEEYGREYSAVKFAQGDLSWRTDEFIQIAREQSSREEVAARSSNRILICDTNAFATTLWHKRYVGSLNKAVDEIGRASKCDLYLLTGDEIPFVQDGLRDGEHIRHEMHRWFEEALAQQHISWKLLRGSPQQRLAHAVHFINELFQNSSWKPFPEVVHNSESPPTYE
jgi:HTH-type transcriptional repressor of NAD biosynthesis genes